MDGVVKYSKQDESGWQDHEQNESQYPALQGEKSDFSLDQNRLKVTEVSEY